MRLSASINAASVLAGLVIAFAAVSSFVVFALGDFEQGRLATLLQGIFLSLLSASLLLFPSWPRLAKAIGTLSLLLLAAIMLFAVFSPGLSAKDPAIYQVSAIALMVLLVSRVASSLWRSRTREDT